MIHELYNLIDQINQEHDLEIELDTVANIYGEDVVERMAETPDDVEANISYLISRNLGDTVSDICNRYGILLCEDPVDFSRQVAGLIDDLGEDYADKMGDDMSCWEALL